MIFGSWHVPAWFYISAIAVILFLVILSEWNSRRD